jgi:methanogenic corrinoid protein MtbC1
MIQNGRTAAVSRDVHQDYYGEKGSGAGLSNFLDGVSQSNKGLEARQESVDGLRRTLEAEIIPRLMLINRHAGAGESELPVAAVGISAAEVEHFTELLLEGGIADIGLMLDGLSDRGTPSSRVLLDLLAPAARLLGEFWENDTRSFAEVTVAMGQLQAVLRVIDQKAPGHTFAPQLRSIVLMPCQGEQHSFPINILDWHFRWFGWHVETLGSFDRRVVEPILRKRHVNIIGLSASQESLLDQLTCDIDGFRRMSRNRALVVMVGGLAFKGRPDLVSRVGADATAEDAGEAVRIAGRLVEPLAVAEAPTI